MFMTSVNVQLIMLNCRWIKDGRIPYSQAVDLLPEDMHFSIDDLETFRAKV